MDELEAQEEYERERQLIIAIIGSEVLAKATMDPFDYAIRLRSGETIRFQEAKVISQDWLHLVEAKLDSLSCDTKQPKEFPRGIDVRISDIVWAKDAPYDS